MTRTFDVIVIGGGIIGSAVAFELSRRRIGRVGVIDHGSFGGEASVVAAGFLPVASMRAPRGLLFDIGRTSLSLYPKFLESLAEVSGERLQLRCRGCLQLADTAEQASILEERVRLRRSQGLTAEYVERNVLRRDAAALADRFEAGVLFPDEAQIDGRALLMQLRSGSAALGATWYRGEATLVADTNVRSVSTIVGGKRLSAACIVVAAGWWSVALAARLGIELPVRPARGEMIEIAGGDSLPTWVIDHDVQLIRQPDGRVWIGGLSEFDAWPTPTDAGCRNLQERAGRLWPAAVCARVIDRRAGIRPCSDVRHPIIDRLPGWDNVYVATGHHRSGFLLAPLTAAVMAARILGEGLPVENERAVSWALPR